MLGSISSVSLELDEIVWVWIGLKSGDTFCYLSLAFLVQLCYVVSNPFVESDREHAAARSVGFEIDRLQEFIEINELRRGTPGLLEEEVIRTQRHIDVGVDRKRTMRLTTEEVAHLLPGDHTARGSGLVRHLFVRSPS